jgi:hypothetical protein
LLGNPNNLAVLRKIRGMISCLGHDSSSLGFAFGDLEGRHVDNPLRIGDLIRQIRDDIVDRGQDLAPIDDA